MNPIRNRSGDSRHGPPPEDETPLGHTGAHHPDVELEPGGIDSPAQRRVGQDPFADPAPAPADPQPGRPLPR